MDIIKVDAIDSTNVFLRDINREKPIEKPICVIAKEQVAGKGQMGTVWQSNAGENLTCSVFIPINEMDVLDQFYISMAASLAIYDTLKSLIVPKLSIKWPNDILSDRYKICGVLIENILNNGRLRGAIIGIGLNINQLEFDNLPQARSIKQIVGRNFNIEEILHLLLTKLEYRFSTLHKNNYSYYKNEYELLLFRKNKPSTFLDAKGNSFVGIIQNITSYGKLQLLLEDEVIKDFNLKEIQLLY